MICLQMNRKVGVACNFNYVFDNEGLLKSQPVTHRKRDNVSETVPNRVVATTDH